MTRDVALHGLLALWEVNGRRAAVDDVIRSIPVILYGFAKIMVYCLGVRVIRKEGGAMSISQVIQLYVLLRCYREDESPQ